MIRKCSVSHVVLNRVGNVINVIKEDDKRSWYKRWELLLLWSFSNSILVSSNTKHLHLSVETICKISEN